MVKCNPNRKRMNKTNVVYRLLLGKYPFLIIMINNIFNISGHRMETLQSTC